MGYRAVLEMLKFCDVSCLLHSVDCVNRFGTSSSVPLTSFGAACLTATFPREEADLAKSSFGCAAVNTCLLSLKFAAFYTTFLD